MRATPRCRSIGRERPSLAVAGFDSAVGPSRADAPPARALRLQSERDALDAAAQSDKAYIRRLETRLQASDPEKASATRVRGPSPQPAPARPRRSRAPRAPR